MSETNRTLEWSSEMKDAAMDDAQKVCDQHAEISRLRSALDDLIKAAEPFVLDDDGIWLNANYSEVLALSEAVRKAKEVK